jgi:hypothetical protein
MRETYRTIVEGVDVIGSDGEQLGTVERVEGAVMIIRRGSRFPVDRALPLSVVASVTEGHVTLKLSADEAAFLAQPVMGATSDESSVRQDEGNDLALGTDATRHRPHHTGQSTDVPSTGAVIDDPERR